MCVRMRAEYSYMVVSHALYSCSLPLFSFCSRDRVLTTRSAFTISDRRDVPWFVLHADGSLRIAWMSRPTRPFINAWGTMYNAFYRWGASAGMPRPMHWKRLKWLFDISRRLLIAPMRTFRTVMNMIMNWPSDGCQRAVCYSMTSLLFALYAVEVLPDVLSDLSNMDDVMVPCQKGDSS
jgi:hypothetical protein